MSDARGVCTAHVARAVCVRARGCTQIGCGPDFGNSIGNLTPPANLRVQKFLRKFASPDENPRHLSSVGTPTVKTLQSDHLLASQMRHYRT